MGAYRVPSFELGSSNISPVRNGVASVVLLYGINIARVDETQIPRSWEAATVGCQVVVRQQPGSPYPF